MERMALRRKEAALAIGVSPVTLDALLRREKDPIPSFRCGKRLVIPTDLLRAWLARQARG